MYLSGGGERENYLSICFSVCVYLPVPADSLFFFSLAYLCLLVYLYLRLFVYRVCLFTPYLFFVCLYVCMCLFTFICLLSVCISHCVRLCLSMLFVYQSVHIQPHMRILFMCSIIRLSVSLSLSICLPLSVFICLYI